MPSLYMPVQRLKVAILPLDLPCSGPVTHLGEILTTGKSHGKRNSLMYVKLSMTLFINRSGQEEWLLDHKEWGVSRSVTSVTWRNSPQVSSYRKWRCALWTVRRRVYVTELCLTVPPRSHPPRVIARYCWVRRRGHVHVQSVRSVEEPQSGPQHPNALPDRCGQRAHVTFVRGIYE